MSNFMQQIAGADVLTAILWGGLIVLTASLIVMMRTNWGQVNPIAKCVVLSVFAHILILGYFYATKLLLDVPENSEPTIVRLSLSQADDVETTSDRDGSSPWDRVATPAEIVPAVEPPERLDDPPPLQDPVSAEPADLPPFEATEINRNSSPFVEPKELTSEPPIVPQEIQPLPLPPESDLVAPEPNPNPQTVPISNPTETEPLPISDPLEPIDPTPTIQNTPNETDGDINSGRDNLPKIAVNPTENIDPSQTAEPFVPLPLPVPQKSTRQAVQELEQLANMNVTTRNDGRPLPKIYALRTPENRLKAVEELGGNVRTEQSVESALSWLAVNQSPDGRWAPNRLEGGRETKEHGHDREGAGAKADTGVSALVVLAFLGAGHTHLDGDYRRNVQYGLEFLMRSQAENGSLAGDSKFYARMYCHGMATLALSEAYAMTGDDRLKPYVEKAVRYTVNSQHPLGGWRYKPGEEGDMSQFGWQVMALKSAELAGVETPTETRIGMLRFLRMLSSGKHGGLASYKRKSGPTPTMTAEALMCRHYTGMNRNAQAISEAMDYIHAKPPGPGRANYYYWYYGTLSLFQSQSPRWDQWNRQMQTELLSRQRTDGAMAGSWNPDSVWGGYGGRAYTTALAALTLEVYYRYLPVYQE